MKRAEKLAARRESAAERQEEASKRSAKERLAILEGRGHGHCAEAKSLRAKIAKES